MGFLKKAAYNIVIVAVVVQVMMYIYEPSLVYEFEGHVENGFENVMTVFKRNFQTGLDKEGSAFAVCQNGKMIVDVWGGYADSAADIRWQKDTLTTMYSVTKTICALSIAVLVDRGVLKYDDLMVKHWPEFGKHGKQNATIKMMVNHELGLAALDEPITFESVRDWKRMSSILENQKPKWPVGTAAGYHTLSYGWPIDQIIRRVDRKKRSLGQFFRDEVAKPNDLDIFIGLPQELEHRVSRLKRPTLKDHLSYVLDLDIFLFGLKMLGHKSDSIFTRSMTNPNWLGGTRGENTFNNPELHALEMGGANGIGNARAWAKLFCLLDAGKIVQKSTLQTLLKPVWINATDKTFGLDFTWGWGFFHSKNPDDNFQLGHPGYGGQYAIYDPQHKLSFAYFRNGLTYSGSSMQSKAFVNLEKALYQALKQQRSN